MLPILPGPGSIPTIGLVPTDRANLFQLAAALDAVYGGRSLAAAVLIQQNHLLGEMVRAARLTLHEAGVEEIPTAPTTGQPAKPATNPDLTTEESP